MKFSLVLGAACALGGQGVAAASYTNAFPLKSTPGVYQGLKWINVTAITQGDGFSGGVQPSSGNTFGSMTNTSDATLPVTPAVITSKFPGSKATSFSLKSFYFACETMTKIVRGGTGLPFVFPAANCTINVAGYKKAGRNGFPAAGAKPDASASFYYVVKQNSDGNAVPAKNMTKFALPSTFNKLQLVQFSYVGTSVNYYDNSTNTFYMYLDADSYGFMDDVVYTIA